MSRDVKEWPVLGTTLKAQPLAGIVAGIVPDLGTSQNCSVVSRDVKERSAGLGAPETRPDLGKSLNCPQALPIDASGATQSTVPPPAGIDLSASASEHGQGWTSCGARCLERAA